MFKRNLIWLGVILVVGGVVWVTAGVLWGLLAAGVTLFVSEVVERTARKRRAEAAGADPIQPLRDMFRRK